LRPGRDAASTTSGYPIRQSSLQENPKNLAIFGSDRPPQGNVRACQACALPFDLLGALVNGLREEKDELRHTDCSSGDFDKMDKKRNLYG
jgi:hypothetical protein